MSLKVAFQMDPIQNVNIDADSSFRLAEEAQARGHSLFFYTPDHLAFEDGRVTARGHDMVVRRERGNHVTLADRRHADLADFDVVWLRQDPPFDMGYITSTHLLDHVHPGTLVVNDPFWVRNYPEKLLVLNFPDLIPPTTIARDLETLRDFKHAHGDIILKPLYGNGGAGVFRLDPNDRNLASLHELFTSMSREPLIAQKFIPDVSNGDKRIILVDGEPCGRDQPRAGGGRDAVEHACRRPPGKIGPDRPRPRDLRGHRTHAAREGPDLRRYRRDRRLPHRDQRDLAHRHPGAGALRRAQHRRPGVGSDRGATLARIRLDSRLIRHMGVTMFSRRHAIGAEIP
jgi:glutathione synthase